MNSRMLKKRIILILEYRKYKTRKMRMRKGWKKTWEFRRIMKKPLISMRSSYRHYRIRKCSIGCTIK